MSLSLGHGMASSPVHTLMYPLNPPLDVNVHPSLGTDGLSLLAPWTPAVLVSLAGPQNCQTPSCFGYLAPAVPSAWNSPRPGISSGALSDLLEASARVTFPIKPLGDRPLGNCTRVFLPRLTLLFLFTTS